MVNDEHKVVVSHAMLKLLNQGMNEIQCCRIAMLAQLGDRVFDRELVSNEFGGIVVQALLDEDLKRLRKLVSLIPVLYIGKSPEVLQFIAE